MNTSEFEEIASQLRYLILQMTHRVSSGHPTSNFSAVELMTMLFFKHLRFDIDNPGNMTNDRFVLSKGHASALYYCLWALGGAIGIKELDNYRMFESYLEGHPTCRFPLSDAAGGSLGQGLSIAAGQAWGIKKMFMVDSSWFMEKRVEKDKYQAEYDATIKIPFSIPRVFTLMGDGEIAEGSVWEAAAWSSKMKLNNLIGIVDVNRFGQYQETIHGFDVEVIARKFEAFGWATIIIDGHNFDQIDLALEKAICYKKGPSAIIAKTIKGKGVSVWEDKNGWHNKMLPEDELKQALEKFKPKKEIKPLIQKPESNKNIGLKNHDKNEIHKSLIIDHKSDIYDSPVSTKLAFGNALVKIGKNMSNLIVLDADMANSTNTDLFQKAYPERFLEMYISEQNMVGVAIGLNKRGFIPVVSTFAAFLTRAYDQFRMAPLNGASVIVNGAYGGVVTGRDGPSQFGLEDISMFRSIYGSTVLCPSDPYQTEKLVFELLKNQNISYIRTLREPINPIYLVTDKFFIGGSYTHKTKIEGKSKLITIVAAGITLHESLKAQKDLESKGIAVQVIDCYSIKPIDGDTLKKSAQKSKALIVVEDHYPEGGLGDAVRVVLSEAKIPIRHLAVNKLPMSGSSEELLRYEKIDAESIINCVKKLV